MKLKKKKKFCPHLDPIERSLEVRDKGPIKTKSLQAFGAYLKYNRRESLIYAKLLFDDVKVIVICLQRNLQSS